MSIINEKDNVIISRCLDKPGFDGGCDPRKELSRKERRVIGKYYDQDEDSKYYLRAEIHNAQVEEKQKQEQLNQEQKDQETKNSNLSEEYSE